MIRVVNFFCFAVTALACLALYHVSEQTRVARATLTAVNRQIVGERDATNVLQAEWARVADSARIETLAQTRLGLNQAPAVQLSSFALLPRRGDATASEESPLRPASVVVPATTGVAARVRLAVARSGN